MHPPPGLERPDAAAPLLQTERLTRSFGSLTAVNAVDLVALGAGGDVLESRGSALRVALADPDAAARAAEHSSVEILAGPEGLDYLEKSLADVGAPAGLR